VRSDLDTDPAPVADVATAEALLSRALDGRRLSAPARRRLAADLRWLTDELPPGVGALSGLSKRLRSAADQLDEVDAR